MSSNVVQVFVSGESWVAAWVAANDALGVDDRRVFETRGPAFKMWE